MSHLTWKWNSPDVMVFCVLLWIVHSLGKVQSTYFQCLDGRTWPAVDGSTSLCSPYYYQCSGGVPKLLSCGSLYNSLNPYKYVFSTKTGTCIYRDSEEFYSSGCSTESKYELPSSCHVFGNIRCTIKGYTMCITESQLCDGTRDCESNEDEYHCNYVKPASHGPQDKASLRGGLHSESAADGSIRIFSVVIPVVLGLIAIPLLIITLLCLKQYCSTDERRRRRGRRRQSRRSESTNWIERQSSGVQTDFVTLDVNSFLPPTYDEALMGNFASSTENLCSKDEESSEAESLPPPYHIVASSLAKRLSLFSDFPHINNSSSNNTTETMAIGTSAISATTITTTMAPTEQREISPIENTDNEITDDMTDDRSAANVNVSVIDVQEAGAL